MITQTVNFHTFAEAFRAIRPDNFSYAGLRALFEHLEQLSDDIGEPIELDVIALCCDYSETSIEDAIAEYSDTVGFTPSEDEDEDETELFVDMLSDYATAIIVDDTTIIIQSL